MKKYFESVGNFLSFLMYISFSVLYVIGLVHSYNKHTTKTFVLDAFIPPFAVYRGIESFWHGSSNVKYSEITSNDLNKKVNVITIKAIEIINISSTNNDISEQELEDRKIAFKNEMEELPKITQEFIKKTSYVYILFTMSMTKDFQNHLKAMYNYSDTSRFQFTAKTELYYDSLHVFYKMDDAKYMREQVLSELQKAVNDNGQKWTQASLLAYIEKTDEMKQRYAKIYQDVFLELFDQKINI